MQREGGAFLDPRLSKLLYDNRHMFFGGWETDLKAKSMAISERPT